MIKKYNITVNGVSYEVEVEEVGSVEQAKISSSAPVNRPAQTPKAVPKKSQPQVQTGGGSVLAPMPGTISDVKVSVGQNVKKGEVLLILEAMKMENEIMASTDGKVSAVSVSKGASVSSGDVLVTIA